MGRPCFETSRTRRNSAENKDDAMLTIHNPATGEVLSQVETDDTNSITEKIALARAAQRAWARTSFEERHRAVTAWKGIIQAERDRLAAITTSETGKPITQAKNELNALVQRIDFFLENAEVASKPEEVFTEGNLTERITREPLGLVTNISAWNYPYFVGANVFVPALLTGNAVLYKPSEYATLTGLAITETLHRAGIPSAVFTAIIGDGSVGALLLTHPTEGVFFTGSYPTGVKVAAGAARSLAHLQLELGGKDPVYVTDDVDVVAAAAATADGAFYNNGQSCCAVERIYVHASIYDAFIEAFVKEVKGFVIGDPTETSTYIGPLTRGAQVGVLETQIANAISLGARVAIGGTKLARPGNYFAPTVLLDVDHRMDLMREESFGPIIGIQKVEDDNAARALMADTTYGLTAGVYCRNVDRARSVLEDVPSGSAYINCCDRVSPRLPWSGRGHSGLGVTLSTYGIRSFTQTKAWHIRS